MPRHSSTDIAIAATHDLTQALLHPSLSPPLSPSPNSQRQHLRRLADILQQHTDRPDIIRTIDPSDTPAAPMPTHAPPTAPPMAPTSLLRVAPLHNPTQPPVTTPLPTETPYTTPVPAVPLAVTPPITPPPKRLAWATTVTVSFDIIATYLSNTTHPGQRRRRTTKAQKKVADQATFPKASITIHPGLASATWPKRRSST
jgi:peptidoglycan/xylan/chitin deacetylase (PgdA/CDA1 family)